jgi:predicted GNAT family N-acyltransferase
MSSIRQIAFDSDDYIAAVALRRAVLRAPLGLDFTAQHLSTEHDDFHFGAFDENALIGVVILTTYDKGVFKLRQMAVSEAARGKGVGARLLMAAETEARRLGGVRIMLEARLTAQAFYARHGYKPKGEVFTQVTLPHILMTKAI